MITRPPQAQQAMRAELETALQHARTEAEHIAGAATYIIQAVYEAQSNGGTVAVDKQIHFLTGAMARLLKDLGVVEHLQRHGAAAQRRALLRKRG